MATPVVKLYLIVIALTFVYGALPVVAQIQLTPTLKDKGSLLNKDLKQLCRDKQETIKNFLYSIDLSHKDLQTTKRYVQQKAWEKACVALLSYFKQRQQNQWLSSYINSKDPANPFVADQIVNDTFTFQGIKGKMQRLDDGRINWRYQGPNNDVEWAYFLNRHQVLLDLANALITNGEITNGEKKYALAYNALIADWIANNAVPLREEHTPTWRPLEAGIRVSKSWLKTFFLLIDNQEINPVLHLLMLMSIQDHAEYLLKFHGRHHNHAVSEIIALTKISLCFPEFKRSNYWYSHAVEKMQEEFQYQIYPDGAVKELTSHYHLVVARDFTEYVNLNKSFGKNLPVMFEDVLERLYNYSIYTSRPDGIGLLNNDSDLHSNFTFLRTYNTFFKRKDWDYITSNGKQGVRPDTTSLMFPWAGHFIMRNTYQQDGQFAFFDVGPWGTTHQHNDKLNFTLSAYGRELLCDNGRMYYKNDSIRSYFNLSLGHNVITIDDKGQNDEILEVDQPIDSSEYFVSRAADFAIATYDGHFGDKSKHVKSYSLNKSKENIDADHTRAVLYLKNDFWIVIDQIKIDRPRKITAYWHFHPTCNVYTNGDMTYSADLSKPNLRIQPVSDQTWNVKLVRGQHSPYVQGWYSDAYNSMRPATCAEYTRHQEQRVETWAWIMYPSQNEEFPTIKAEILNKTDDFLLMKVHIGERRKMKIAVNLVEHKTIQMPDGTTFTGRCAIYEDGKSTVLIP